jgi:sRNA-binding carbon storage regulator CsrA
MSELYLDRSVDDAIVICHEITVRVVAIDVASIELKTTAPENVNVERGTKTLKFDGVLAIIGVINIRYTRLPGRRVRLCIDAPRELSVNREEVERREKKKTNQ